MDDALEFLTKIYSELTEFRKETNTRLDKLETGQKKIETTLENDIKSSLQALHERAAGNTTKLDEHSQRLRTVENKLDYLALSVNAQDKRLEVVESSRKKKAK